MSGVSAAEPSLLLLFGPPAVGKTTVGQELERLTGFRLFHLHQVVDLIGAYFPYSASPDSPFDRLVVSYRSQFFQEAARAGLHVITTMGWRFDIAEETDAIRAYTKPFVAAGGQVYVVELIASLAICMARNRTENRRRLKRIDWSTDAYLCRDAELHRYDSGGAITWSYTAAAAGGLVCHYPSRSDLNRANCFAMSVPRTSTSHPGRPNERSERHIRVTL